jgi:hypothetical protein
MTGKLVTSSTPIANAAEIQLQAEGKVVSEKQMIIKKILASGLPGVTEKKLNYLTLKQLKERFEGSAPELFEYKSKNELKAEVKAEQVKQRVEGVQVKDEDYNSDHDNYVASGSVTEEDEPALPLPKRQKVEKKEN